MVIPCPVGFDSFPVLHYAFHVRLRRAERGGMSMRPFAYRAPTSIAEAVALLGAQSAGARPFAGGTDLLVLMRHGLLSAEMLVDLKRIPELNELSYTPEAGLTIGAAVPLRQVADCPEVAAHYPALHDAVSLIGGPAIRERATLGGNLGNAAPSADSIPPLMVLEAWLTVAGPEAAPGSVSTVSSDGAIRRLPVGDLCTGPRQTALRPGEMIVSIHLPPPPPHTGSSYLRFIPRVEMDIAVAGAGAWVQLSPERNRIEAARIALSAVGPTPLLAAEAGASLAGQEPSAEAMAEAARLAQEAAQPISDVRGTAAQRRHLIGVLTRRALEQAIERARRG